MSALLSAATLRELQDADERGRRETRRPAADGERCASCDLPPAWSIVAYRGRFAVWSYVRRVCSRHLGDHVLNMATRHGDAKVHELARSSS